MTLPLTRETWLAALRSGEYNHGQGRLRTAGDRFCCLGVACNIYDPSIWTDDCYYLEEGSFLPEEIVRTLGLNDRDPKIECAELGFPNGVTLSELNDSDGMTLARMADIIEKHSESIFT